jgi:aryl-alcohol dehydrogenase-like predicted oxidoreductase
MAGAVALAGGAVLAAGGAAAQAPAGAAAPRVTDRRRLGALEVSAIGIGVQNMSRTFQTTIPSRPEMIRLIRAAYDQGVTFFDTAEVYGPHECERILGEAAQSFRNDIVIATKFGFNVDLQTGRPGPGLISRPEHIRQAVEGSLRRLRTDRVELLYSTGSTDRPIEDVAGAVAELRRRARCSLGPVGDGRDTLRRAMPSCPLPPCRTNTRCCGAGRSGRCLPACRELGIGFVPFAPLGYGFLTGAIDAATTFAPATTAPAPRACRRRTCRTTWRWWSWSAPGPSEIGHAGQVALAWLMAQAPWIVPIPGSTQMPHMLENIGAAALRFTPEELAELDRAVRAIEVRGARMPPMVQAWSDVEAPPRRS